MRRGVPNFPKNLHEIKKFWAKGERGRSLARSGNIKVEKHEVDIFFSNGYQSCVVYKQNYTHTPSELHMCITVLFILLMNFVNSSLLVIRVGKVIPRL